MEESDGNVDSDGGSCVMGEARRKINMLNEFLFRKGVISDETLDSFAKFKDALNFKDQLLANLYATNEFLKKELEEKNYIIRKLLQKEGDDEDKSFENNVPVDRCSKVKTDVFNDLSFNSECLTFNDDSLDDSNVRVIFNHTNEDEKEDNLDKSSSTDSTVKKHISPTCNYVPVDQQLDDYRTIQRDNFRIVKKSCSRGYRLPPDYSVG